MNKPARDDEIDINYIESILRKKSREELERISTGIRELDIMFNGGFIKGSLVLLCGPPGSGKTTMALQFAFSAEENEKVLYITLTEPKEKLTTYAKGYTFYDDDKIASGQIVFVDFDSIKELIEKSAIGFTYDAFLSLIKSFIEKGNVKRLIIDSTSSLKTYFESKDEYREFLMKLSKMAFAYKSIIMLVSETESDSPLKVPLDFDAYISDVIIFLSLEVTPSGVLRWLQVLKARGTRYSDIRRTFKITEDGIVFV